MISYYIIAAEHHWKVNPFRI